MSFNYGWRGPNIVKDGLIVYMDASTSNSYNNYVSPTSWNDISGNANNGAFTNGPIYNSSNRGNISFDGSNDLILVNYSATSLFDLSLTKKMTWDYWAKWNQIARIALDGGIAFGLLYGANTLNQFQWQTGKLYSGANPRWFAQVASTTQVLTLDLIPGDGFFSSSAVLADNTWVNFTYTYDQATAALKGYINGVNAGGNLYGTNPTSFPLPGATFRKLTIGGSVQNTNAPAGNIGSVKMYNRDLSAAEVLQNYNATKGRFGL